MAIESTIAILSISNVNAQDTAYYTSSNGVQLTEKEYNFIVEMHNED